MNIVVETTEKDVANAKADHQPALMYALDRAGFKNAFIDPCHPDHILSATVSHIESWIVKTVLSQDGTGFYHLELTKPTAVAFGLTVDDGMERRERDDLLNPTITPANETTAESIGLLDSPSPEDPADYDGTNGHHEHPAPVELPNPSEPVQG